MKILIAMAGSGHRFKSAGYQEHKPMIDVNGEPMIRKVIENLKSKQRDVEFIFICLSHKLDQKMLDILRSVKSTIIALPYITEGAACTALKARDLLDDEPLIITACDQLIDEDIDDFIDSAWSYDGCLATFNNNEPSHSFSKVNKDGLVTEVAEKKVISNHANIGIYWFKKGKYFAEAADKMIAKNIRTNNEFYVAPVYNQMLDKKVGIYEIPKDKVHLIGTPKELEIYINAYR
jgi:NDP-sugar pyrophosphorylase family protein